MRKIFITAIILIISFLAVRKVFDIYSMINVKTFNNEDYREISGTIENGETFFDIFKRYNLDIGELMQLREASADVHRLRNLYPGRQYKILIDDSDRINTFLYWIDDDNILSIKRDVEGFYAEKLAVDYEKRIQDIGGTVKDNLISSIGEGRENLMLALQISDILAWDIDFTSDIQNGDSFRVVVEGLYLNDEFKRYGDVLCLEFSNNGEVYRAYRFEYNGEVDYYDAEGRSLRRAFLKAPLSFRRISSTFSKGRFHPVLKIYRPHHGLDYAAPAGTPVSAAGDGVVQFAGYKGQYGKLVIIRHPNGYRTYYGHLSSITEDIRLGKKIVQGQLIGKVGATGLSTGPHLHYEMRINNRPVNPLTLKLPRGRTIHANAMSRFNKMRDRMATRLAVINVPQGARNGHDML